VLSSRGGDVHGADGAAAESGRPRHAGAVDGAAVAAENHDVPRLEERGRLCGAVLGEPVEEGALRPSPAEGAEFRCFGLCRWERIADGPVFAPIGLRLPAFGTLARRGRRAAVDGERRFVRRPVGVEAQAPADVGVPGERRRETRVRRAFGAVFEHVLRRLLRVGERAFGHDDGAGALRDSAFRRPLRGHEAVDADGGKRPRQAGVERRRLSRILAASRRSRVALLGLELQKLGASLNVREFPLRRRGGGTAFARSGGNGLRVDGARPLLWVRENAAGLVGEAKGGRLRGRTRPVRPFGLGRPSPLLAVSGFVFFLMEKEIVTIRNELSEGISLLSDLLTSTLSMSLKCKAMGNYFKLHYEIK